MVSLLVDFDNVFKKILIKQMKSVQYFYASMKFNVSVFDKGEKESLHNLVFLQIAIGRFHCINCCCHVCKKNLRVHLHSSFFF